MATVVDKAIDGGPRTVRYVTYPDSAPEGHIQGYMDSTIGAPTLDTVDERKVSIGYNSTAPAGWVQTTTGVLTNMASGINTTGKYAGLAIWNTTTSLPVFAKGPLPTDPWLAFNGTVAHQPA